MDSESKPTYIRSIDSLKSGFVNAFLTYLIIPSLDYDVNIRLHTQRKRKENPMHRLRSRGNNSHCDLPSPKMVKVHRD